MAQWLLAWRNLMRRKMRTLLTVLSIVIGVASTLGVIAAVDSAEKTFPQYLKAALGKADFSISGTDAYFSEDIHKEMEKSGDAISIAVLKQNTKLQTEEKGISAIQKRVVLSGYSSLDTPVTGFKTIAGDLQADGAVITDKTAAIWKKEVGDAISFETDNGVKTIKVTAIVKYTMEIMGPGNWNMAKYHHWSVALPLSVVQDWYGKSGKIDNVLVKALNSKDLNKVEAQVNAVAKGHEGIYMQPIVIDISGKTGTMDSFFMALYIAGFLGIALSAFIIFNSLFVSIQERRNEFAVLKTIGYTPGQLQKMVFYEVVLLSIIGTFFGLIMGYGLALGLKALIFMLYGVEGGGGLFLGKGLAVSVLAGLLVPVIASWYPIKKAGMVSVIEVLKEDASKKSKQNRWLGALGVVFILSSFFIKHLLLVLPLLIGIALVFPYLFKVFALLLKPFYNGLGFSGEMAVRNLNRNLNRTSMTSVILCMGISMIVLMSSLNSALLQSYERVIYSSYGGNLDIEFHHIEKDDLSKLKSTEGVADAQTYSWQSVIWIQDGQKRKLPVFGVGEEWIDTFPLFAAGKGEHSRLIKKMKSDEIIMDRISYDVWGGKIGESISLETLEGPKEFKVAAVVDSMKNSGYGAFMKEETFRKEIGIKYEKNALVIKDEKTSPLQLRERIFDQYGERIMQMFGPEDWVTVIGATFTGSFTLINGLVVLAIIVSGIGITNTLLINIMERVREIGMMRAVGVTRKQIIRMIMLEGFGMGLAATVIGSLFGILLIYMTSTFLEVSSLTFDFGVSWIILLLIIAFGIIISLISSFSPARRAAKTHLSEALRYE